LPSNVPKIIIVRHLWCIFIVRNDKVKLDNIKVLLDNIRALDDIMILLDNIMTFI